MVNVQTDYLFFFGWGVYTNSGFDATCSKNVTDRSMSTTV